MKFAIEQISLQSLDWPELLSVIAGHCVHDSSSVWVKSDPRALDRTEARGDLPLFQSSALGRVENPVPLER